MNLVIGALVYGVLLCCNIVLYLLWPVLAVANVLSLLLQAIVYGAIAFFYLWLMWGVAMLVFGHTHDIAHLGWHMLAGGAWRLAAAVVALYALMLIREQCARFSRWLDAGGFMIWFRVLSARGMEQETRA